MRKSAAVRLAACLLAVSVVGAPLPSWADAPVAEKAAGKNIASPAATAMPLEKAISTAKEKLPIPAELDMFSSDYQEYDGRGRWVLRWYGGKQPESSINVTVDAETGVVENVNYYQGIKPGARYQGLPAFSREQSLEIARKEGARFLPDKFSSTVLTDREYWFQPSVLRERDYPIIYDFYFRRTSGGVPVNDQGLNIGVNAETGQMVRFDCNWSASSKLPSPEGKVSPDQARKIFLEKSGYELTYFMAQREDPDTPGEIKLAYRLKPPGRFILNALTGEVINNREVDIFIDEMGAGGGGGEAMYSRQKMDAIALTPAENRAVEENKDFISADRAQEIASGLVDIPKGYTATGRSLERHYGVPGSRVWNVQFSDSEKKNWVRVSVDARNGELISFSRDNRFEPEDYYKVPEVKVSQDQAQKSARDLIARLQPSRLAQVDLRDSDREIGPWVKMGQDVPRSYSFFYGRKVNGIPYPENGFRVRVSSTTGEVLSYDMTWWETSFPKAEGVIDLASANEKFLSGHPLVLEYARGHRMYDYNREPQYYLIYRPSGRPGYMLDAVTGQEIDYSGKPVVKKDGKPFSDIAGHPAEEDITLLAQEGIISGEGGKFRPDDQASVAEVLAMLVKANGNQGPYYPLSANQNDPWYKAVLEAALAKGILEKDLNLNPEAGLNRLQLARLGVNAGGWGKLARLSQIFKLEVADAGSIPTDYRGFVAAFLGLELLAAENGSFNPEAAVTRAQAASFLVRLLKQ